MFDALNQGLAQVLYQLSSALLLPVMAAVACLFVAVSVAAGGFLREWTERPRIRRGLRETIRVIVSSQPDAADVWQLLGDIPRGLPQRFRRGIRNAPNAATLRALLSDLENDTAARLARLNFVTRVGPMLGLLGTLIPFGPALAGLAIGDVQELSANLVTAFATTVIGLLCGCLGYGMGLARRAWYARDFDEIELIVQYLIARSSDDATQAAEMGLRGR